MTPSIDFRIPSTDDPSRKHPHMRLAFSTNAYLRHPFDEAAARIAALGYEGLELLADVPHAWPAGLLDVQKRGILQAMEQTGLAFSNINAFMMNAVNDRRQPYWYPSFIEPEPHYRQVRIDHTRGHSTSAPSWAHPTSRPSPAARWRRDSRGKRPSTCSSKS